MNGSESNGVHPVEGYCRACGAWVLTCAAGTAWARGRCGNRRVNGENGRKCALYGQTQRFAFSRAVPPSSVALVSRRL